MTRTPTATLLARAASGTLRLARWLLVLVLVFDQVGSPLHLHRHDSGVDALWSEAHGERHVEEGDVSAMLSHAVLAVRSPAAERQQAGPDLERTSQAAASAPAVAASPLVQGALQPERAGDTPVHRHRSLPPEGRAPPRHA